MKLAKDGVIYDTERATLLCSTGIVDYGLNDWRGRIKDDLYRGKHGKYFIVRYYYQHATAWRRFLSPYPANEEPKIFPESLEGVHNWFYINKGDPKLFGITELPAA